MPIQMRGLLAGKRIKTPVASLLKTALCILFFTSLAVEPLAALLSPKFSSYVMALIKNHSRVAQEQEALRRNTPLWANAVTLYNTALYAIGASGNPSNAVVGADGWVFLGNLHSENFNQATRRRILTRGEVRNWCDNLSYQSKFAERRGIPYLFVIAPAKWSIYPDKLPSWAQSRAAGVPSNFDLLLTEAKLRNLPLLDIRSELRQARAIADTYSPLNSHWSDFGAWVGWQAIGREIRRRLSDIELFGLGGAPAITTIDAANEFEGLAGIKARNPWTQVVGLEGPRKYKVLHADGTKTELIGSTPTDLLDLPRRTENTEATSPRRALIIRDSFGTQLSTFLQASFRETYQVNHHVRYPLTTLNLPGLIADFKPDLIIYEMTERYAAIPLGDAAYWHAANAFDEASIQSELVWPAINGNKPLPYDGDDRFSHPASVQLPRAETPGTSRIVKFVIDANGEAAVHISFVVGGHVFEKWHAAGQGLNEIYLEVPAVIDGDRIRFAADPKKGTMKLVSIAVRAGHESASTAILSVAPPVDLGTSKATSSFSTLE